jgi:hypothetical protein
VRAWVNGNGVRVRREHRLAELREAVCVLGEDGENSALGRKVEAVE